MKKHWITVAAFVRQYAFYAALALCITTGMTSCDDPNQMEIDKYQPVHTTMVEYQTGKFKIENEETISDTISRLTIKKLDGTVEDIPFNKVKEMFGDKDPLAGYTTEVEDEYGDMVDAPNPNYYSSHSDNDLLFLLYWSNFGYSLGRPFSLPVYRGYYSSTAAYSRACGTSSHLITSKVTTTVARTSPSAPIRSSSNYGHSFSRGYSSSSGRGSFGG